MIFSTQRHALIRAASAIMPLGLLSGISFVWYCYHFGLLKGLLSCSTPHFGLTTSGFTFVFLSVATTNASLVVFLISFWKAVSTPAGSVPSWYVRRHRAAAAWFQTRQARFTEMEGTRNDAAPTRSELARPEKRVRWADASGDASRVVGGDSTIPTEVESPRDSRLPTYQRGRNALGPVSQSPELSIPARTVASSALGPTAARLSVAVASNAAPAASVAELAALLRAQAASKGPRFPPNPPPPELRGAIGRDGGFRPGAHDLRWCKHCNKVKPPRSHHCSVCASCVLKVINKLAVCVCFMSLSLNQSRSLNHFFF